LRTDPATDRTVVANPTFWHGACGHPESSADRVVVHRTSRTSSWKFLSEKSDYMVESDATASRPHRNAARHIALWFAASIAFLLICAFIGSFFLDSMIRPRIEANMNASLKGYHATLPHAHLQLLGLTLTLRDLTIEQLAHPQPAVATFPVMRFRIDWKHLFFGRVVADVRLEHPSFHIDEAQLASERKDPTSLRQKGWQDALQNAYPFKINRLVVDEGDVVYVEAGAKKPLRLSHLDIISDNIRSIEEPNNLYPSRFHASMTIFDRGKMSLQGRANYLMKPFPGMKTNYTVTDVPMDVLTTASHNINIAMAGGTFSSDGFIEYSPRITNVDVNHVTIDSINVTYTHRPETQQVEAKRIDVAGKAVEKETNRRAVNIDIRELEIKRSKLAYDNQTSNPPFPLFIAGADLKVSNLVNHQAHGPARMTLKGKFMGSGDTNITGTFLASDEGPEFDTNISIENTDLTSLNPLLRAYGRFDVAQGRFTLYSQLDVKDGRINGYAKPMFSDLKVYDPQKDKNKGVIGQTKQVLIGTAAHLFKNRQTQKVATQVTISGSLKKADVSTWQAFVEIVENAFIKTILPGFDREVGGSETSGG
jgi:hypothetical protein